MTVLDQRMSALELANEIRTANAKFKQGVHKLTRTEAASVVIGVLLNPAPPQSALPVRDLLAAQPFVGDVSVDRMLARAGIANGRRRVRDLTDRQRRALADVLQPMRQTGTFSRVPVPLPKVEVRERKPQFTTMARDVLSMVAGCPGSTRQVHDWLGRPGEATQGTGASLASLRRRGFVVRDEISKVWSVTDAGRLALGVSAEGGET